jgi:transmembrane sensor
LSAIAATVLVGVIGVVAWRAMAPSHPGQEIAATAPPAFSAGDQAQTITLADGSQAVLDPQSALAVRFTNARRDLRLLRGRALFEVRHDGRPFAVAADDTTTTATGTRFSVALTSEGAMAVLERGQVIVTRLGDTTALTLAPGETLVAVHGKPMTVTKAVQRSPKTAAPTYVEFRDTPLTQAAEQIARGSSTPIHVIGGAGLLKVTGRFKLGDPLGFVRAVTEILPVRQRPSRDGGVDLILNEPQNSARIDSTNRRPRGSP